MWTWRRGVAYISRAARIAQLDQQHLTPYGDGRHDCRANGGETQLHAGINGRGDAFSGRMHGGSRTALSLSTCRKSGERVSRWRVVHRQTACADDVSTAARATTLRAKHCTYQHPSTSFTLRAFAARTRSSRCCAAHCTNYLRAGTTETVIPNVRAKTPRCARGTAGKRGDARKTWPIPRLTRRAIHGRALTLTEHRLRQTLGEPSPYGALLVCSNSRRSAAQHRALRHEASPA